MWDKKKSNDPLFLCCVTSAAQAKQIYKYDTQHTILIHHLEKYSVSKIVNAASLETYTCIGIDIGTNKYKTIKRLFPFRCLSFLIFHFVFGCYVAFTVWHFVGRKSAALNFNEAERVKQIERKRLERTRLKSTWKWKSEQKEIYRNHAMLQTVDTL